MHELSITGAPCFRPRRVRGFWWRQFNDAPTTTQRLFDVAFGIVMPVVCFYLDPIVFRGWVVDDRGFYQRYQLYAYTISAVEMVALCAWLLAAGRGTRRPATLAGMLFAGAAFAFLVGVAILPFSLIGLFFYLVGALGFIPFLTAFVYLRNGWRSAATLGSAATPVLAGVALACGFFFALAAPAVLQATDAHKVTADGKVGRRLAILLD